MDTKVIIANITAPLPFLALSTMLSETQPSGRLRATACGIRPTNTTAPAPIVAIHKIIAPEIGGARP